MNSVRTSGLNFTLQDTPFSMVLTLRKSCVKHLHHHPLPQPQDLQHHDQNLMDIILLKFKVLEETKVRQLTSDLIEATSKYKMKPSQHKSSSFKLKDEQKVLEVIYSKIVKLKESLEIENEELLTLCNSVKTELAKVRKRGQYNVSRSFQVCC